LCHNKIVKKRIEESHYTGCEQGKLLERHSRRLSYASLFISMERERESSNKYEDRETVQLQGNKQAYLEI
jgi:hypothetical protein